MKINSSSLSMCLGTTTSLLFVGTARAEITLTEVAQHNTASDCWGAVGGRVFDVTGYIPLHPNADIEQMCGAESTDLFDTEHPRTYLTTFASAGIVDKGQLSLTLAEVAQHSTSTDCWGAIGGKVYDVTDHIPLHPNMDITQMCGVDGTAVFDAEHPRTYLTAYASQGVVETGTLAASPASTPSPVAAPAPAPVPSPAAGGACFSGRSKVHVEGKGLVSMDGVQIGDSVWTANGSFSEVYRFGHFDTKANTEYLQMTTTSNNVGDVLVAKDGNVTKDISIYLMVGLIGYYAWNMATSNKAETKMTKLVA